MKLGVASFDSICIKIKQMTDYDQLRVIEKTAKEQMISKERCTRCGYARGERLDLGRASKILCDECFSWYSQHPECQT